MLRTLLAASFCAVFSLFASTAAQAVEPAASPMPASPLPAKPATPTPTPSPTPTPGPPFANMSWREIGPAGAGGRVAAVAGSATNPKLYYLGSAGGGVWKSENGAQTWDPVFDKGGAGGDRRRDDRSDGQQHRLGWYRRSEPAQRRELRRRRLQDDRRRRHVDERRLERDEVYRAHPRRSAQPQSRRRRGAGRRLQRQHATRRVRNQRRRPDVEADALRGPGERCVGSGDERAESERALRRHLEVSTTPVDLRQRRGRRWALPVDRRRRDVDEARRAWPAARYRWDESASRSRRATATASTL